VCQSDFLTLANVFAHFRVASKEARQSPAAENRYCNQHFLGRTTLREMMDLKVQYLSLLIDIGLVPKPAGFRENYDALEAYMEGAGKKGRGVNSQAGNTNLVLAAVCAGLYPNVARATSNGPHSKPSFVVPGANGAQNSVSVHRSSFNGALKSFTSPWLIYHEKFTTTRVYVSPTSVVSPYALLLFGGPLSVDHLNNRVVIDEWIDFQCPARTAVLFKKMRVCLVDVLEELIRNPLGDDGAKAGPVGGKEGETVLDTLVGLLQEEEPKAAWIPGGQDDTENK
jgi:ATP-dependent RNA helicase DHX29